MLLQVRVLFPDDSLWYAGSPQGWLRHPPLLPLVTLCAFHVREWCSVVREEQWGKRDDKNKLSNSTLWAPPAPYIVHVRANERPINPMPAAGRARAPRGCTLTRDSTLYVDWGRLCFRDTRKMKTANIHRIAGTFYGSALQWIASKFLHVDKYYISSDVRELFSSNLANFTLWWCNRRKLRRTLLSDYYYYWVIKYKLHFVMWNLMVAYHTPEKS